MAFPSTRKILSRRDSLSSFLKNIFIYFWWVLFVGGFLLVVVFFSAQMFQNSLDVPKYCLPAQSFKTNSINTDAQRHIGCSSAGFPAAQQCTQTQNNSEKQGWGLLCNTKKVKEVLLTTIRLYFYKCSWAVKV